jgi:5-formyltetrahydrofolate cyclo-ligase
MTLNDKSALPEKDLRADAVELRAGVRKQLRGQLATKSALELLQASGIIAERLLEILTACASPSAAIAVYWPIHHEPNLLACWTAMRDRGFSLALPLVVGPNEPLTFALWDAQTPLMKNAWGIPEVALPRTPLPLVDIDVVVMPCVGFWPSGHRLGYGGGYYDRSLALWRQTYTALKETGPKRRWAFGLSFDESEITADVPLLSTDQACDAILTPTRTIYSAATKSGC